MAALAKTTHVYATHDIPLKCEAYESSNYPKENPVFLFFHSGGLVGGSRLCVPPWLAQTCVRNQWPLISVSYRLVPQVRGLDLLEDVRVAYEFALNWGGNSQRKVIVGGASAGFSLASMTAHHLQPTPLALLSITGIPTYRHSFFSSSTLIPAEGILTETEAKDRYAEPLSVGYTDPEDPAIFFVDSLLPSGERNPKFLRPKEVDGTKPPRTARGSFFAYLVYTNAFPSITAEADKGFEWARDGINRARLTSWPVTVFIQGSKDTAVFPEVCQDVASCLGDRARFFLAQGQDHLFEAANFTEDEGVGMDAVRRAVQELEVTVEEALARA